MPLAPFPTCSNLTAVPTSPHTLQQRFTCVLLPVRPSPLLYP